MKLFHLKRNSLFLCMTLNYQQSVLIIISIRFELECFWTMKIEKFSIFIFKNQFPKHFLKSSGVFHTFQPFSSNLKNSCIREEKFANDLDEGFCWSLLNFTGNKNFRRGLQRIFYKHNSINRWRGICFLRFLKKGISKLFLSPIFIKAH